MSGIKELMRAEEEAAQIVADVCNHISYIYNEYIMNCMNMSCFYMISLIYYIKYILYMYLGS